MGLHLHVQTWENILKDIHKVLTVIFGFGDCRWLLFHLSSKFSTMMLWQTLLVSHPESCPPFLLSKWTQILYKSPTLLQRAKCSEHTHFLPSSTGVIMIALNQSWWSHYLCQCLGWTWPYDTILANAIIEEVSWETSERRHKKKSCFSNCCRYLRILWVKSGNVSQHLRMPSKTKTKQDGRDLWP